MLFRVAGLTFAVENRSKLDISKMLTSFAPFVCESADDELLFTLTVTDGPAPDAGAATLVSESHNDAGNVRLLRTGTGYRFESTFDLPGGAVSAMHVTTSDAAFTAATVHIAPPDVFTPVLVTSMLRIVFAQAALARGVVSVHASCVVLDGRAYLFLGKSGTGKSTHARQWLAAFSGCRLLNDDNPAVAVAPDGTVTAYGTPWSGKTPCYLNESAPLAGIVRLRQAPENAYTPLEGLDAFTALLPSFSAIHRDPALLAALTDILIRLAETVPTGLLACRPDLAAARMARQRLRVEGGEWRVESGGRKDK